MKENPKNFHRFNVVWTPTVLVMDPKGDERSRLEGYLSKEEFQAHLEMGLSRVAFMQKNWGDAERRYDSIIERYPKSIYAPQAVYWRGVSRYSESHDGAELANTAKVLAEKYPGTEWALRSVPWADH